MSSLPEKSQTLTAATNIVASKPTTTATTATTTTFFFRSDSIRKIKCTAVYPFQVAGIKLSKNAIIELLETNINKARVCTQKAMLNFYYVILKLLSTLFTLWDNKVPAKASVTTPTVDSESTIATKTNDPKILTTVESYQTRLLERFAKIQKHKSRLNGDKAISSVISENAVDSPAPATVPASTSDLTCLRASSVLHSATNLNLFKSRSKSLLDKSKLYEYCLILSVHAGLFLMYLQVVILGIALNTTSIPSGLIFLLVTVAIIGYILVKVSLKGKQSASSKSPKSSPLPKNKLSSRSRDMVKDDSSPERQSRSKARKLKLAIELKYKTLSKVKLL